MLVYNSLYDYDNLDNKNMLIYKDNLLALKELEKDFYEKIKCGSSLSGVVGL